MHTVNGLPGTHGKTAIQFEDTVSGLLLALGKVDGAAITTDKGSLIVWNTLTVGEYQAMRYVGKQAKSHMKTNSPGQLRAYLDKEFELIKTEPEVPGMGIPIFGVN